jgi:hypothetical protein
MNKAEQFFLEHAGWATPPGREDCAILLAAAEARASAGGVSFHWEIDEDSSSADWKSAEELREDGGPYAVWGCVARDASGGCFASLWSIDFGPGGDPWGDPYRRVVEAELATEYEPSAED